MSDRSSEAGENHAGETYVAYSGRCRIKAACQLTCVAVPPDADAGGEHIAGAYIGVAFQAGEEHVYDRLQWRNKDGSPGGGFVVRTGDGDAHLMGYLFERFCEVVREAGIGRGQTPAQESVPRPQQAVLPRPPVPSTARRIRVVNVKGLNKPEQRAGIVYVGRKFAGWPEHELHNPYKPKEGEPVGTCLAKYKAGLLARLTLDADLAALWEECGCGKRPLGCWCVAAAVTAGDGSELVCHGQVLAEMLHERFGVK